MEPNQATEVATDFAMGFWDVAVLLVVLVLLVIPFWKIWQRTGHSGAWGLLALVPLANLIALWVLAFKEWPAMKDRDRG